MNNEGKSWFDDDPEWQGLRDRMRKAKKSPTGKSKTSSDARRQPKIRTEPKPADREHSPVTDTKVADAKPIELRLNVKLPNIKKPSRTMMKRIGFAGGIAAIAIIGLAIVPKLIQTPKSNSDETGVAGSATSKPNFDTILPSGELNKTTDNKVSYDPKKQVVSFTDEIGHTSVTVSQQPLPTTFKENPENELKKVAHSFAATEVIHESSPSAYLGTSEDGPQFVLFVKNELLVFIQSKLEIDKRDWAEYITQLR